MAFGPFPLRPAVSNLMRQYATCINIRIHAWQCRTMRPRHAAATFLYIHIHSYTFHARPGPGPGCVWMRMASYIIVWLLQAGHSRAENAPCQWRATAVRARAAILQAPAVPIPALHCPAMHCQAPAMIIHDLPCHHAQPCAAHRSTGSCEQHRTKINENVWIRLRTPGTCRTNPKQPSGPNIATQCHTLPHHDAPSITVIHHDAQ